MGDTQEMPVAEPSNGQRALSDVAIETRRFTRLAFVFLSLNAFIIFIAIAFSFFVVNGKYPNAATAEDPVDHQSDSGNVPGPCSSGPCVNQGKCVNMSPHEYICSCPEQYFGRYCEEGLKNSMFHTTFSGWVTQVPPNSTLHWSVVRYDPNNKYDNSSGKYTIPQHGHYPLSLIMRSPPAANNTDFVIFVDTTAVHDCSIRKNEEENFVAVGKKCTWNLQLRTDQKIRIHSPNQNSSIIGKFEGSIVVL